MTKEEGPIFTHKLRWMILTEVYARPHMLQQYALAFLMACAERWICKEAESVYAR